MSKKTKQPIKHDEFEAALQSTPVEEVNEAKPEIVFNTKALTLVNTEGAKWILIEVEVDHNTLTAGEVKIIGTANGRYEAIEKFKIACMKNKII